MSLEIKARTCVTLANGSKRKENILKLNRD